MMDRYVFEKKLKEFSELASRKYSGLGGLPSYAYPCGFMESMMTSMFAQLSARDQQRYFEQIEDTITQFSQGK